MWKRLSMKGKSSMKREAEAKRWLDEASEELATARWDLKGKRYSAACFWSQQAAEKALKAFLYSKGEQSLFEHSVAKLTQDCLKYSDLFALFKEKAALIDRYYIPTRYPNGLPFPAVPSKSFSKSEAQEAIKTASEILELVKDQLET